jgi:hypothetical protein
MDGSVPRRTDLNGSPSYDFIDQSRNLTLTGTTAACSPAVSSTQRRRCIVRDQGRHR